MMVVDDLEKHFRKPITKAQKSILESIARFNLKEQPTSNMDIAADVKNMSYDSYER